MIYKPVQDKNGNGKKTKQNNEPKIGERWGKQRVQTKMDIQVQIDQELCT